MTAWTAPTLKNTPAKIAKMLSKTGLMYFLPLTQDEAEKTSASLPEDPQSKGPVSHLDGLEQPEASVNDIVMMVDLAYRSHVGTQVLFVVTGFIADDWEAVPFLVV